MKNSIFIFSLLMATTIAAQVPRNVVVEVFTNTRCSICGAKDPGIFHTIHNYPEVIQIAYYPSTPYSNCFFSQQNKSEYDGRTRNYGVYGSTPRVFVQGIEVNNNLDTVDLVSAFGQMSNFEIKVAHVKITATDAVITTTIYKRAADTITSAKLYVAVGEDSVVYSAPNGIPVHYGVMRKAMTDSSGMVINLPILIGDSLVVSKNYTINTDWNQVLLTGYGFLIHPATKEIINANKHYLEGAIPANVVTIENDFSLEVLPNPASNLLIVKSDIAIKKYTIIDLLGKVKIKEDLISSAIAISSLPSGIYLIQLETEKGATRTVRFVKTAQ